MRTVTLISSEKLTYNIFSLCEGRVPSSLPKLPVLLFESSEGLKTMRVAALLPLTLIVLASHILLARPGPEVSWPALQ